MSETYCPICDATIYTATTAYGVDAYEFHYQISHPEALEASSNESIDGQDVAQ